jgi:hypothetical protein
MVRVLRTQSINKWYVCPCSYTPMDLQKGYVFKGNLLKNSFYFCILQRSDLTKIYQMWFHDFTLYHGMNLEHWNYSLKIEHTVCASKATTNKQAREALTCTVTLIREKGCCSIQTTSPYWLINLTLNLREHTDCLEQPAAAVDAVEAA